MRSILKYSRYLFLFCGILFLGSIGKDVRAESYSQMFTLTGYYSPLPNQSFYITGSYEAEIRLNGQGKVAADGTPVYPGMMAAPSSMAYGAGICVPGFGCGKVHDRGQAIVKKGERDLARHDRLDLWMGYGEEGLLRALTWGVQHLECEVYAPDDNHAVSVNFSVPMALSQLIDIPLKSSFETNLGVGDSGKEVLRLQESLKELGFWTGEMHGLYDENLQDAVFAFQLEEMILESWDDLGAGRFGPQTRQTLASELYDIQVQRQVQELWEQFHFDETIFLSRGMRNESVLRLQQILVETEYMTVYPTGYFGPQTEAALIAFQLGEGIISSEDERGAGNVGPKTTELLNKILDQKRQRNRDDSARVLAYQKDQMCWYSFVGVDGGSFAVTALKTP